MPMPGSPAAAGLGTAGRAAVGGQATNGRAGDGPAIAERSSGGATRGAADDALGLQVPRPARRGDDEIAVPVRRASDPVDEPGGRRRDRGEDAPAADRRGALRPGDVGETEIAFWDEAGVAHFRAEWHEVKAGFVDDPVAALTRAHDLLTEAVHELTESLLAERDALDPLRNTATPDTESMRMAMHRYREFLERILSL
ncbi:hypothetical protein [Krasilnikovia sp. MM14-A1259]|uniref:hypothetical protein n=1 Tax=Krasilnikovia sp. MM14-A1259 TaxID=3373539 RepID=UPI00399D2EA7